LKNIENEVLVLEKSRHPNVVAMVDRMKSKNSYYLILDYCNSGDLATFLSLQDKLNETEAKEIIYQIVDGMNHLHSLGVLHRDLKLANILLHFPKMEG
jgi:serine/threonine protein kinase